MYRGVGVVVALDRRRTERAAVARAPDRSGTFDFASHSTDGDHAALQCLSFSDSVVISHRRSNSTSPSRAVSHPKHALQSGICMLCSQWHRQGGLGREAGVKSIIKA